MVLNKIPTFQEVKDWANMNFSKQEKFSISTDGSGQATIELSSSPNESENIAIFVQNELRVADFVSESNGTVTVNIRVLPTSQEKVTSVGNVQNQPNGVSVETSVTKTESNDGTDNNVYETDIGGSGGDVASANHRHEVTHIYEHEHGVNTTTAELISQSGDLLAANETIDVVISYI